MSQLGCRIETLNIGLHSACEGGGRAEGGVDTPTAASVSAGFVCGDPGTAVSSLHCLCFNWCLVQRAAVTMALRCVDTVC